MRSRRRRVRPWALGALAALFLALGSVVGAVWSGRAPAEWGAEAILHPFRRPVTRVPRLPHETVTFASEGERFEGWLFRGTEERRRLVVYLHGIADNRQSGIGVAERLVGRGYDVFAFDGRAHGRSGGDACTYGYLERHDVGRALDALGAREAILIGHSLGASIALQAAAVDRRVVAVVAASPFADLPTIVRERAGWVSLPAPYVEAVLGAAGERAGFPPAEASPVALAAGIEAPVLLLHGASDRKTLPEHSRRVAAALSTPHRLVVLPGVGHDEILGRAEAWREIEALLRTLPSGEGAPPAPQRSAVASIARSGTAEAVSSVVSTVAESSHLSSR